MRLGLAAGALLLSGTLTLVGCAQDPLDLPGDARTLADFAADFPEIDITALEESAAEGELHFTEYGTGWNLSAQSGAAPALIDWFTESRDLNGMRHGWSRHESKGRDIWLLLTAGGKVTIVTVSTSSP